MRYFGSGQEENRTPMTARSPHFECGASTNFATRPYIQLFYYTLFTDFATTILKIHSQSFSSSIALKIFTEFYRLKTWKL
jgi:hypothetical protein